MGNEPDGVNRETETLELTATCPASMEAVLDMNKYREYTYILIKYIVYKLFTSSKTLR